MIDKSQSPFTSALNIKAEQIDNEKFNGACLVFVVGVIISYFLSWYLLIPAFIIFTILIYKSVDFNLYNPKCTLPDPKMFKQRK
jgi:hypothetical protein